MSDIRDILELEQGLASTPSKEAIVGGNKVSLAFVVESAVESSKGFF